MSELDTIIDGVDPIAPPGAPDAVAVDAAGARSRALTIAWMIAADVTVAVIVAGLIIVTLLFASHVSSFIYIDF